MGAVVVSLVAILILLQFSISILYPSLQSVSKLALTSLALLCAFGIILSNLGKYELPDFTYDIDSDDEYREVLSDATAKGIALEIANKYGVDEDKIFVTITELDVSKMRAEHIYVRINDVRADYRAIREFITKNFLVEGGSAEVALTE